MLQEMSVLEIIYIIFAFYSTVYTLTCQLRCCQIFLSLVYRVRFTYNYFPNLRTSLISVEYI